MSTTKNKLSINRPYHYKLFWDVTRHHLVYENKTQASYSVRKKCTKKFHAIRKDAFWLQWLYCNYPWRAVEHPVSSILRLKCNRSKKVCLHRLFGSNFLRMTNRLCKLARISRRFVAVKSPPLRACGNLMCFFASGKLPTYPLPSANINTYFSLKANC